MKKMMSGGSSSSRMHPNPFRAVQWQELELQALFFKFMVSGLPIPPNLIFKISGKSSFNTQPQSQNIGTGWSCFDMGVSRRKIDPEPNRCRRTDGKKWRCSRHTSGDSKYCERHMHRGKSRGARKLVESSQSASTGTTTQQSILTNPVSSGTTCDMKPVKDSNFMTFLGMDSGWSLDPDHPKLVSEQKQKVLCNDDLMKTSDKRQRMMMTYHQFIEESPSPREKRDPWLSLVI